MLRPSHYIYPLNAVAMCFKTKRFRNSHTSPSVSAVKTELLLRNWSIIWAKLYLFLFGFFYRVLLFLVSSHGNKSHNAEKHFTHLVCLRPNPMKPFQLSFLSFFWYTKLDHIKLFTASNVFSVLESGSLNILHNPKYEMDIIKKEPSSALFESDFKNNLFYCKSSFIFLLRF